MTRTSLPSFGLCFGLCVTALGCSGANDATATTAPSSSKPGSTPTVNNSGGRTGSAGSGDAASGTGGAGTSQGDSAGGNVSQAGSAGGGGAGAAGQGGSSTGGALASGGGAGNGGMGKGGGGLGQGAKGGMAGSAGGSTAGTAGNPGVSGSAGIAGAPIGKGGAAGAPGGTGGAGGTGGVKTGGAGGASGGASGCTPNLLVPTLNPATVFAGPITITKGGTYTGNWRSDTAGATVVTIATTEDVTIDGAIIAGYGNLIYGASVGRVTVTNTRGFGLGRTAKGDSPGKFIHLKNAKHALIANNYMEHVWGIRFDGFTGNGAAGDTIKVLRNRATNIDSDTKPHFIQFAAVYGLVNSELGWNEDINTPYDSHVEDVINIFDSTGTSASPIHIHDNYLQGAYPLDPATDGYSGGGILLGDGGFNSPPVTSVSAWVVADHNQVISTTNYGVAIAAGHDNHFTDNRVIASGMLPDGTYISAQNVGLYVWDIRANPPNFFNNWAANNVVGWAKKNAGGTLIQNNTYFPGCAAGLCVNNTTYGSQPTRAMEAAEHDLWVTKMKTACVKVGYAP